MYALVVPSNDPEEKARYDKEVEEIAMQIAMAYEQELGAEVRDVSTPQKALEAGLTEYPGFDLLSIRPGGERIGIEVKGRAKVGDIELSENEWAKAATIRDRYWLYVVYNCATPNPMLLRIQDPFGSLLARAKGGVIIDEKEIFKAAKR